MDWMGRARALAERSKETMDLPVGSVLVYYQLDTNLMRLTEIEISSGYNTRKRDGFNPLAHAEMNALNGAVALQVGGRFHGCVLYTTLEPCPLCYSAALLSRVDGVVYDQPDTGGAISCGLTLHKTYPPHTMFVERHKSIGLTPVAAAHFKQLVPILQQNNVSFVVSGGTVIANRFKQRMSTDIDIHMFSSLEHVKATCDNIGMTFLGSRQHDRYTVIHRFIYRSCIVDFIEELDDYFRAAIQDTSVQESIEGLLVPTMSTENLLITRLMAARKDNVQDDLRNIRTLPLDYGYITTMTNHLGLPCISS